MINNTKLTDKYGRELTPLQFKAYNMLEKIKNNPELKSAIWKWQESLPVSSKYTVFYIEDLFENTLNSFFRFDNNDSLERYFAELEDIQAVVPANIGQIFERFDDLKDKLESEKNILLSPAEHKALCILIDNNDLPKHVSWRTIDDAVAELDDKCSIDDRSLEVLSGLCDKNHIRINDTWYLNEKQILDAIDNLGFKFNLSEDKERIFVLNKQNNESITEFGIFVNSRFDSYLGINEYDKDVHNIDSNTWYKLRNLCNQYWHCIPSHERNIELTKEEIDALDKLNLLCEEMDAIYPELDIENNKISHFFLGRAFADYKSHTPLEPTTKGILKTLFEKHGFLRLHINELDKLLNNVPTIKAYKTMQLIDGSLRAPMSGKVNGKLRDGIILGSWERSEERPDLCDDDGYFILNKANGKSVPAKYNPYFHSSDTMLNDQFSEAQDRNNLVVVEVEIPVSEIDGTEKYQAEKAHDPVGVKKWNAGVLQGKITGKRTVYLTRYDKPIRIVPNNEVARHISTIIRDKTTPIPTNVFWPDLKKEMEKIGYIFVKTDNKGVLLEGEHKGKTWSNVYGDVFKKLNNKKEILNMNDELNFPENLYSEEVNSAKTKLGDIIRETFLTLSEEEKEAGTTTEQKNSRYVKLYRPMIDEIMAAVITGDQDLIKKINDFDLNKASHKEENSYYSKDEAFMRDVEYKLLPELYEIVQDKIRKEYDEKKIPYIVMFSSESPVFPTENKVYTVKEFNELLLNADSEFHDRREYAYKKYGSADNYWKLKSEGKLPEEDKGLEFQFGYDKTNFKFFNIPNPANPEDTFSYEPSRYDIGDGNGSVFDYVRSTCSHDEFIEALNQLEKDLYFPEVTKTQREDIDKIVAKEAKNLSKNLTEKMAAVDEAQEEYKELHKKWLIESSEAEAADKKLEDALSGVKAVYDKAMSDAFGKILNEYPNESIYSQLLQYAANDVKKMVINELYLPSRNAQKAMNAKDYASYNSTDWAKLRKIWALFPANVNMDAYVNNTLKDVLNFEKHIYYNKTSKEFFTIEYCDNFNEVGDFTFYDKELNVKDAGGGWAPAPASLNDALEGILDNRYNFNFDPDGMSQGEYEEKCERLKKLYPENWIEVDNERFERIQKYAKKELHYGIQSTDTGSDFTELKSYDECVQWVISNQKSLEDDNAKYIQVLDLFNPTDDNIVFYKNVEWNDGKSNLDDIISKMEDKVFKTWEDIRKLLPKSWGYDFDMEKDDVIPQWEGDMTEDEMKIGVVKNLIENNIGDAETGVEDFKSDTIDNMDEELPSGYVKKDKDYFLRVLEDDWPRELWDIQKKIAKEILHKVIDGTDKKAIEKHVKEDVFESTSFQELANDGFIELPEEYFDNRQSYDAYLKDRKEKLSGSKVDKSTLTVNNLNKDQLTELKQQWYGEHLIETENRTLSYEELAKIDELVSDEKIKALFEHTVFTSDDFSSFESEPDVSVSQDVLNNCEKIIPKGQFEFTKELMQGEEGEFFAKKLTELSERCKKFTTDEELVNEDGTHEIAFHYFGGSTDIFLTQIYEDGTGFGYTILNGDVEMSEWGYTSLEDLRGTNLELDYHIPEGKTVEQALYEINSDYFKKPKTKEDIINEAGNSFVKKVKKELKKGGKMPEVVAGVLSDMKLNKPEDYKNVKAFLDSKGVFKSEKDFISFCKKTFEPKKNNEISGVGR